MKIVIKYIILIIFFSGLKICFAQTPETPAIKNLTVNHSSQLVEINWSVNSTSNINGYTVKRKIIDGTGVVPGTFNTIFTINDNSVFNYTDNSTEFGTSSKPNERIEYYAVTSFKEESGGLITFSNLSNIHNTIYLRTAFNACQKSIQLVWNNYSGWTVSEYQIFYKTNPTSVFQLLTSTSDTIYNHQISDTNLEYFYYIKAIGPDTNFSDSNESSTTTNYTQLIDYINADYATVISDNEIELSFTIANNSTAEIYKLVRSTSLDKMVDTIAEFEGNQTNIIYKDNITPTVVLYYKLIAKDQCNAKIGESNIASNILLNTELKNQNSGSPSNHLNWNHYYLWNGEPENYKLFLSFENEDFVELETFSTTELNYIHDISDYIFDIYNGSIPQGKFCYYIETSEINNPYSISGKSRSNISCIIQEPIIYVPTAFNPNSNTEENKIFKPKLTFINDYLLIVYSKWGNKVFETTQPDEGWTGLTNSGNICMRGTYTYYIRIIDEQGKKIEKSGFVNLIY